MVEATVFSCPPPGDAVETKTPAYFPASAPLAQRPPVESKKALNCPGIDPYRVGMPNRKASKLTSSSGVMTGMSSGLGGAWMIFRMSSERVSATR
jgi:hypothetical protein